jgi:hypothetical protein
MESGNWFKRERLFITLMRQILHESGGIGKRFRVYSKYESNKIVGLSYKNNTFTNNTFAKIRFEKLIIELDLIDFVNIAEYKIYN